MLLAIDIGNSEIKTGIWDGERWAKQLRRETHPVLSVESYQSMFKKMLGQPSVNLSKIDRIAVASVVPQASDPVTMALKDIFGVEPFIINASVNSGIKINTDQPEQMGADLIAGAVAAYQRVKDTCIVVDCGTATTVMVVERPGVLLGGAVCIGLKTSINALIDRAAQLQEIPLEIPGSPIAGNTIHAMQSGLIGGHLSMIEGLIDKMRDEIGPAKVAATGGLISILADHTNYFDFVEPTLVLDGIRLVAEQQKSDVE